jgi:hypothetical protein
MRTLVLCILATLIAGPARAGDKAEEGFTPLFNGKDLQGWKQYAGKEGVWMVEKEMIVCGKGGGGWLGTEKDYANFELRLQYRLTPGGNSGVYIRAPETGHISRVGMEIQLLDDEHKNYAKLNNYQYTGAVYHVVGPMARATKPAGEWNEIFVVANGRKVEVTVNGQKVVDADLDKYLENPAIAKEHTGLKREAGKIGLQSHTDRVEFRNVRIRERK